MTAAKVERPHRREADAGRKAIETNNLISSAEIDGAQAEHADPYTVFLARAAARDRLVLEGLMAADEAVIGLFATSPAILMWSADDGGDDDIAQ